MNLIDLTRKLVDHCKSLGFGYSTNELNRYLEDGKIAINGWESTCEWIIHEMCHMLLLYGPERLQSMWQQQDMDDGFNKLSKEDQDENEIETTALTIMLARDLDSEQMEMIARGNVKSNLSPLLKYKELDELLDPYLVSSNRSHYNQLLYFIDNLQK